MGTELLLPITDLGCGGEGVGRLNGLVVFVENAVPGDTADVVVTETRRNYVKARLRRLETASPLRADPPCPIYAECGGCQLQHLSYAAQLDAKQRFVNDAMRLSGLRDVPIEPCLPPSSGAAAEFGYRNKMQLVVGRGGRLGLYRRHTHSVVPMDACLIADATANRIMQAASPLIGKQGWAAYDERSGKGVLRHLLARVTSTHQALVVLVATTAQLPHAVRFSRRLNEAVPQVAGVLLNVNSDRTNVILGRRTLHIWGRDYLTETVKNVQFRIGATSFFQVNTRGLERLYEVVEHYLAPRGTDNVLDGYCGVGALSLLMARQVAQVVGLEEVAEAVENARHNALLNGLQNARFECGKVEDRIEETCAATRVDAIVVDPPRKGCERSVLEAIARHQIPRMVYVSCNPATLGRDLAILSELGYQTRQIQPLDMFPQTSHVESIALITRRAAHDQELRDAQVENRTHHARS